jgi:hypothetical protein
MQQSIYETFQAILFSEMPKNSQGNVIVFDREIKGWNIGDRKLKPAVPSISIYGSSLSKKEIASLTYEIEHTVSIKLETGNDSQLVSSVVLQEFERLVYEIFNGKRQIWVMTQCPFCLKKTLSPEHFIIEHNNIFASYVSTANTNASSIWSETHADAMPSLPQSRLAVMAFDLIYERILNNKSVNGLTAEQKRNFDFLISNKMKPIRLLYDVKITDIKPTDNAIDKQTFHTGEISIHGMELSKIPSVGPDNVSTEAWSIR